MEKKLQKLLSRINTWDTGWLFCGLFCLSYLNFALSGNEEHYLGLSKTFMDPKWNPHAEWLHDFPGARLLFQCVFGTLLKFFSFESVVFFGRAINFILLSRPLARISRHLNLSNIEALFILQVLYLSNQAFFAGEWIFGGVEAKTFAYVFIFYAIDALLNKRPQAAVLFAATATWLHILVGGWFFIALCIYFLLYDFKFKKVLWYISLYGLITFPFVIYLYLGVLQKTPAQINGVSLSWIYVYFGAPHHSGLFLTLTYFIKTHLLGVLLTVACFFLCSSWVIKPNKKLKNMQRITQILLGLPLLFVLVAVVDREGRVLNYYPFRQNALAKLMILLYLGATLKAWVDTRATELKINLVAFAFFLPMVAYAALNNIHLASLHFRGGHAPNIVELAQYIRTNTNPQAVFLTLGKKGDVWETEYDAFDRLSERSRFVSWKFNPAGSARLYEWYVRMLEKKQIKEDLKHLFEARSKYTIDFLVARHKYNHPRLKARFQNAQFYLYEIK